MLKYFSGDIFNSDADIICHQVNCQGVFGRGIAGQIKTMFPEVEKTYRIITKQWLEQAGGVTSGLLGRVSAQPIELYGRWFLIANLYGQDKYGKSGIYTDYPALLQAVTEIRDFVDVRGKLEKVAFPYGIGCGNAGGDWNKVEEIINSCFSDYQGEVQIWKNDSQS